MNPLLRSAAQKAWLLPPGTLSLPDAMQCPQKGARFITQELCVLLTSCGLKGTKASISIERNAFSPSGFSPPQQSGKGPRTLMAAALREVASPGESGLSVAGQCLGSHAIPRPKPPEQPTHRVCYYATHLAFDDPPRRTCINRFRAFIGTTWSPARPPTIRDYTAQYGPIFLAQV